MPPRSQMFYCTTCSKGYARSNEYEAHLSSYDHSHRQRLKDMKAMVRDPNAGSRARKAEAKADGLVSIKLPGQESTTNTTGGGGFKKGGFKKSGFKSAFTRVDGPASGTEKVPKATNVLDPPTVNPGLQKGISAESDTEDEGYEVYDPRFPTN
ncbi:hypothetical protein EDB81DRAFT_205765 [Dactylonectria macrodidyma]|uniref:C2H2-type domain-containing protein n=1 Tax=Dactylonectria macrodidyma TaxID=307937 RepID=A0A9P9DVW1_9HYPO|nr:hypothetical protein EDB81DRAFT_205765 [Dactylonectria macrodidyma]